MKGLQGYWKIGLIALLLLGNCFVWYFVARESRHDLLTLSYLDVGTGDAVYIEGPNGVQVLIDTGTNKKVLSALGKVMPFYDRSIDVVITTDTGVGHSGGLTNVVTRYDVLYKITPVTQGDINKQIDLGNGATLTLTKIKPFNAELKYGANIFHITNEYPFTTAGKTYNPNITGTVTFKISPPSLQESELQRANEKVELEPALVSVAIDSGDKENAQGNDRVLALLAKVASSSLPSRIKTTNCHVIGPYPDRDCSPGAIFPNATLEQICVSGYTKKVRNVSVATKKKVYASYGIPYPQKTGTYEADHIIPLELGGSNDTANLFPEAQDPRPGFREKDLVENYLHAEACAGRIDLGAAQKQIASDWLAVYNALSADEVKSLRSYWSQ